MTIEELRELADNLFADLQEIKREVRKRDPHLYERWKAGGFMVDDGFVSMYPDLIRVVDALPEEELEDEDGD